MAASRVLIGWWELVPSASGESWRLSLTFDSGAGAARAVELGRGPEPQGSRIWRPVLNSCTVMVGDARRSSLADGRRRADRWAASQGWELAVEAEHAGRKAAAGVLYETIEEES